MREFWLCFVPLFVAVDVVGVLPMYLSLTERLPKRLIPRVILQSVLTASIVASLFLFVGQAVFRLLGITVADFMVAGGTLLFVVAMSDLLSSRKLQREMELDVESVGAVPIGVPLIVGPAVLTTILILAEEYGRFPTVMAAVLNIMIAGLVLRSSRLITRLLGKAGTRTFSKIANLIMAAIAVMIVRKGLSTLIGR